MTTQPDAAVGRRLGITIAGLLLGQFMVVFNANVVITAIPSIVTDLGATAVEATWLVTATLLAMAVSSPIWGRLSDGVNPLMLLRVAVVAHIVLCVAAALAPSILLVIVIRAAQGLALGGCISLAMIVLANIVPPRERGKYTGWMSALQLIGTLAGPFIGGVIAESTLGWRGVMVAAVPIGIAILVLLQFAPRLAERPGLGRIDYLGAVLIAASVSMVLVWISFSGTLFEPWGWPGLLLGPGGLVLFGLAILVELRADRPILPLRVLRGRVVALAAIGVISVGLSSFGLTLLGSLYFQFGHELSPSIAGLLLVASALGSVIVAFIVGQRTKATGRLRRYLVFGAATILAAAVLFALLGTGGGLVAATLIFFLFGVGQGAFMGFIVLAAQNAVGLEELGSVSGFMTFVQFLGGTTAVSFYGAWLQSRLDELEGGGLGEAAAYLAAVPQLFWFVAAFALVGLVAVVLLPSIRLRSTIDEAKPAEAVVEE